MTQPLLPADWAVPQIFKDRLGDGPGRQRTMVADGHVLLVLHKAPDVRQNTRHARVIWRGPDGTWKCNDGTEGMVALKQHLAEYDEVLISLDAAEHDAAGQRQYIQVLTRLAPVLRAARHLHSALQEARDACKTEKAIVNARDHAYRLERTIELLMSDARGSLDLAQLEQAEKQATSNESMAKAAHRLNMLAALFLPLATLSGILGVSFDHPGKDGNTLLPLWKPEYLGFWMMVTVGLVAGLVIAGLVSQNKRGES